VIATLMRIPTAGNDLTERHPPWSRTRSVSGQINLTLSDGSSGEPDRHSDRARTYTVNGINAARIGGSIFVCPSSVSGGSATVAYH
jgi:hypothetical protein